MNIAEYIEQNMRSNGRKFTVFYHKFATEVGINDKQVAKEQIELDLQELHKCQVMKKQFDSNMAVARDSGNTFYTVWCDC